MEHTFRVGDRVLAWRGPSGQVPATFVQWNGHNSGKGARNDVLVRFDDDTTLYCTWSRSLRPLTGTATVTV